jgi:hypothetical protein
VGSVRRGVVGVALATVVTVGMSGCGPHALPPVDSLSVGHQTLDGKMQVWPPRGSLASDQRARAAVANAVNAWRTPAGDRPRLKTSGILWLGELDGRVVSLVAADIPVNGASWLLQLDGPVDNIKISSATQYTNPGYLVYSDVLPVRLGAATRYLTSARVDELTGADGQVVALRDGMSDEVNVPRCQSATVTARLKATESLPRGQEADRLLDLGTAVEQPRYPLVGDDKGTGATALKDMDTCVLAGRTSAFGSVMPTAKEGGKHNKVPSSWPIASISQKSLGEIRSGPFPGARLERLTWQAAGGRMHAVVFRPPEGAPVVSTGDRNQAMQAYRITIQGSELLVLSWDGSEDSPPQLPDGVTPIVEQPGFAIVPKPNGKVTYRVTVDGTQLSRTIP